MLEPGTPLLLNWHQELICEYLTRITEGKLTRLIINIPPRYSKSYLASVCWPVWEWTFKPWNSWVFATYAQGLSTEHSTNRRTLIQSNWYQERYGDRYQLAKDENLKTQFRNTSRGQMFATSFGGSVTGFGAEKLVIDDPHNPKQAISEKQRETAITTFKQTLSTRLNDKKTGAIALIMQRLHTQDLSGFLLGLGEYTHLCIQGEAPARQTFTFPISGKVITREVGEPLHAEREGLAELAIAKKNLGEYGFAGQYQQTPSPLGGGLIKRTWWRTWDYLPRTWDNQCISVDAAFKGNANSDYVVIQCWGKKGPKYYLLDQIRDRMTFSETEIQISVMIHRWPEATARIIEDKANGPAIIDRMSRTVTGLIPWNPGTDSKISRISALTPLIEAQNILLPKTDWTDAFIEEASAFPNGANDDQLDAAVQAINYLEGIKRYDPSWLRNI